MSSITIETDMDSSCAECGKKGATKSGICLQCVSEILDNKNMKSPKGRAFQKRFMDRLRNARRKG